jgi:hypothetical protein
VNNAGEEAKIDHSTLEEQGIMLEPTIHLGKYAFLAGQKVQERARTGGGFEKQIQDPGAHQSPAKERTVAFARRTADRVQEWIEHARTADGPDDPELGYTRAR